MTGVAEPSGDGVGVLVGVAVGVTGVLVGMGCGVLVAGMVLIAPPTVAMLTAVAAGGVNVDGMLPGIWASWARVGTISLWHPTRDAITIMKNKHPIRKSFIMSCYYRYKSNSFGLIRSDALPLSDVYSKPRSKMTGFPSAPCPMRRPAAAAISSATPTSVCCNSYP